ncbi:MAG: hydrogen gas-evolving membrane-bound hydrogenase subunit E, partial [Actinomycetota bacterium]
GAPLGVWIYRRTEPRVPDPVGADVADAAIEGSITLASRLTARVQHGSLPVYVVTMAFTASVAAIPYAVDLDLDSLVRWDTPLQVGLGLFVVAAAAGAAIVRSRLGAALGLGAAGVGVSGLFLVQGAPDLALTQLLVETVIVVGFVLGLGHLTRRFPPVGRAWRGVRVLAALGVGATVAFGLIASGSQPSGQSPVDRLEQAAVEEGGGDNVVNVILTDIRALDTLGEVVVLLVVAVGILALARASRSETSDPVSEEASS